MRASSLACLSLLVACGREGVPGTPIVFVPPPPPTEPRDAGTASPDEPTAAPPTSYAGVTGKMLADAYQQVSVSGPWDEVMADLTNRVGAPTFTGTPRAGGDLRAWALIEHDSCYVLTLYADARGTMQTNYGAFQRGQAQFTECSSMTSKP